MYKPEWLSRPAEALLADWAQNQPEPYDVVIVGSGYGGAVAAARLSACAQASGKALRVCVLERGREHVPGTFPNNASDLPGHMRFSRFDDPVAGGAHEGLFDLRIGKDVSVLVANGLGGGSLINAGVAKRAERDVFDKRWPDEICDDWSGDSPKFEKYYGTAEEMLGATPAVIDRIAKHEHFTKLAGDLAPERAPITVSYHRGPNAHGVTQPECLACGDCATGCNVGAKNTLLTNYLAIAYRQGAEIFTGATVSHVAQRGDDWAVFVAPTVPSRPLQEHPLREIRARHVILAAGTFGSTEILLRSRKRSSLTLSTRLGERFSTNGDMISVLYKPGENVNAVADETRPVGGRGIGPTITGIARDRRRRSARIVIEDLAIPGALRRIFEEIVTTSVMLQRLTQDDNTTHRPFSAHDPGFARHDELDPRRTDPAAIDPDLIAGCQVFAAMGDDCAKGTLQLVPGWDDAAHARRVHDGTIRVDWPGAGGEPVFREQDEIFRNIAREHGWTYLPNPLWRPFPEVLANVLSGAKPGGLVFSVHPLGGCAMANSAEHGVVDHMGRVFSGASGRAPHEGLLVLDGSIIPGALGINPLLTITALAERAIELYIEDRIEHRDWQRRKNPNERALPVLPEITPSETAAPPVTAVQLSERMTGLWRCHPGGPSRHAELTIEFDPVRNLADFLRNPRHRLMFAGTLKFPDFETAREAARTDVFGSVEFLVRGSSSRFGRVARALWAFVSSRGLADLFGTPFSWRRSISFFNLLGWWRWARGMWALASNVGEIRYLLYEIVLQSAVEDADGHQLPAGTTIRGRNTLSVDMSYFLRGFASPLQIVRQRDLPAAWMDFASLGLFLARIILKIHFWSFRLPKYQKHDPTRDLRRLPGPLGKLRMERYDVEPETPGDVSLRLTRYRRDQQKPGTPVVLLHGLGSGGIQFATPRVNPNLAQYLAQENADVWVAELRTSIAPPSSDRHWTLDEVALGDVPRIVDFVLENTEAPQVDVVAHCVGSAMFCTAALAGRLQHSPGRSKIRKAVLMQVGPLVTLSNGTRLRALATAPLLRFFPDSFVDFSVDDSADWVQSAIDRLLNTYPYPADEAEHHRLGWRDDDHIANCNRWAGIDGMMIRHENLSREMLQNLGEVLGHSSTATWAQTIQYGFLERLTNSEGVNSYVTNDNIHDYFHFPVLFVHGEDNDVFHWLTSVRSRDLLLSVHGDDFPAVLEILPGYRHLDPLIGRNAPAKVFAPIARFLKEEHKVDPAFSSLTRSYFFRRPLVGPVLGWFRYNEKTGRWWARVWCRLDDLRSPVSCAVVQVSRPDYVQCLHVDCPSSSEPGQPLKSLTVDAMDTVLCLDLELPTRGRYEICVLSAHEDLDQGRSAGRGNAGPSLSQRRNAELSLGKRMSTPTPHLSVEAGESLRHKLKERGEFEKWRVRARGLQDEGGAHEKIDHATVSVPEQPVTDRVTLALGSCRYPGWLFDRNRADETFGRLADLLQPAKPAALDAIPPPSALFLVGDQIYADATAGVFDPKTRRERFYEAYREAWTAPNARHVLSQLPVYMMMDDHEAGDDWHPQDFVSDGERRMRQHGLDAFRRYQWLHSPGNRGDRQDAFWYDFTLQGFPVFVCDTRSARVGREAILDPPQYGALTQWLEQQQIDKGNRPKFVVSPSVVVPFRGPLGQNGTAEYPTRSDGWDGFPEQLVRLFTFIARKRIENIVFLCGDAHVSMDIDIWFEDKNQRRQDLSARCILASPMYGPYPFVNATPDEFVKRSKLVLPGVGVMRYEVQSIATWAGITVVSAAQDSTGRWQIISNVEPDFRRASVMQDVGVPAGSRIEFT
jgi:cholesterol oxidase